MKTKDYETQECLPKSRPIERLPVAHFLDGQLQSIRWFDDPRTAYADHHNHILKCFNYEARPISREAAQQLELEGVQVLEPWPPVAIENEEKLVVKKGEWLIINDEILIQLCAVGDDKMLVGVRLRQGENQ